jgi:hypothetical protein
MIRTFALSMLLAPLLIVPAVAQHTRAAALRAATTTPGLHLVGAAAASAVSTFGDGQSAERTGQRSTDFDRVQYRGRPYGDRRGGYRGNFGRDAGIGIGALIIGGIILSEAARAEHQRDHGDDWQRCADTYRSFEPSTGMYTGYDGIRRTCPYLN